MCVPVCEPSSTADSGVSEYGVGIGMPAEGTPAESAGLVGFTESTLLMWINYHRLDIP